MSVSPMAASRIGFSPLASSQASGAPAVASSTASGAASSTGVKPGDSTKAGGTAAKTDAVEPGAQASAKELKEAVAKLNERLKPFIQEAVRFNVDEESGKLIVTVVDTEKNTVIRQIPSQEALKMSRSTDLKPPGLLLNTKA